jgi:hypothetical protein
MLSAINEASGNGDSVDKKEMKGLEYSRNHEREFQINRLEFLVETGNTFIAGSHKVYAMNVVFIVCLFYQMMQEIGHHMQLPIVFVRGILNGI